VTSYVDTHCHLNLLDDPTLALDAAPETIVVAVTELPSQYRLVDVRFRHDRRVRVALGLHPLRAATAGAIEEGLLLRLLPACDYVGEVGLDFSTHGRSSRAAQIRVFDRLLAESEIQQKVVSVHSRGAAPEVVGRLTDARVPAILHWYTGPARYVDDALAAGMYFSINPPMLKSKKGQDLIAALPRDRVLTETDAPFARAGSRPVGPRDIARVIEDLARHWDMTCADARQVVHDNLARLFEERVGRSAATT
jgi:TatD DNase family protein